ncbi:LysR family transcriptional regulator [Nesterenkonia ebinurensis]|uniref:LysR family transcriptional regulator n=1 Tax=Nesterenkonia ebinurensis TaxID=2608252 RepID=UPI00168B24D7|nr:LysR family transcriptional regulator [Nesterenkonia ebinurensis]
MDWGLRHIRCLVAVADTGTITDAAIELGISQPQASRTISALEQSWDVRLVSRGTREVSLTPEGIRAVEQGRHLLDFAESMAATARGEQHIRLGYVATAAGRHTPALTRRWRETQPEIDLELVHAKGLLAGLNQGLCDAAVLRREPDPGKYASTVVGTERLVAGFADTDLWSRRRRLKLADFAGRPLVVNTGSEIELDLWAEEFGPLRAYDADSVDSWLDAIAAGRGVGVATEATANQHRPIGIRYLPITDAAPVPVRLCWPKGRNVPGLEAVRELLKDLYARQS